MEPCTTGEKIALGGTKIRLTHLETGCNLHSHNVRSPLSSQQEITAYGADGQGDGGDDWVLYPVSGVSDKYWRKDQEINLRHDQTGKFLGCTEQARFTRNNCGHNCPVMNHLEVFGRGEKDGHIKWKTSIGVFLHK